MSEEGALNVGEPVGEPGPCHQASPASGFSPHPLSAAPASPGPEPGPSSASGLHQQADHNLPSASLDSASCSTCSTTPTAVPNLRVQGMNAVAILDQLTETPASYLLSTSAPAYRSHAAKQQGPGFGWANTLSPMVFHTEAGMVLYDRVVTGNQEGAMLSKLCKPKDGRPPNSCVSKVVYSGGAGAPTLTSPHHSPGSSPGRQRDPAHTAHAAHPSPTQPAPHARSQRARACKQQHATPESGAQVAARRSQGSGADGSASGRGPHGGGSCTAQHSMGSAQQEGAVGVARSGHGRRQQQQRQAADDAAAASRRYFQQQRAVVTATQVFTWGGRLSHRMMQRAQREGGAAGKAGHAGMTPVTGLFTGGTHRAPLRLDAYQED